MLQHPKKQWRPGVNKVLKTLGDPNFKAKPRIVKIEEVGVLLSKQIIQTAEEFIRDGIQPLADALDAR
jgi:hypothetical protein